MRTVLKHGRGRGKFVAVAPRQEDMLAGAGVMSFRFIMQA